MRALIVGCGYVGLPLGAELVRRGHTVFGLRRSSAGPEELSSAGLVPLVGDITRPEDLRQLPRPFDWVINTVSSNKGGAEVYEQVYVQGTGHLIDWLRGSPLQKYVYTSSTSVYTQADGSTVDESSPTLPTTATNRWLIETETLLRRAVQEESFPAVILRVAGIYGPGRGHLFLQYLRGEARVAGKGERLLNMIHRDDVVGAIVAALERGRAGEIYNAVDDEPVSQLEFFTWLSQQLGRPLPPPAGPAELARGKRGLTHKKVSNRRLKSGLGYALRYPTFREGYAHEIERLQLRHPC